jgi:phosphoribosylamine---glycine ligase
MKILLITISARGHAIAEAMKRSPQDPQIIHVCPSRNPGIRKHVEEQFVVDSLMDFDAIVGIAKKIRPDFAFVAPDDPIGGGLADVLENIGIQSVAPMKDLARIESSKSFARELLREHGIDASPAFRVFRKGEGDGEKGIREYIERELGGEYVVKYDGLLGGKGVKVSGEHLDSVEEGAAYAMECLQRADRVVIEEKLRGHEFSLMSFVSREKVVSMPAVKDHKRAFEGDTGPNTGGMGSFSDTNHLLPFLEQKDYDRAHEINVATAKALGGFRGILYGGFIVTDHGVKLIEYNARFGDPEALNVLPLLSSDFAAICVAMISGELNKNIIQFDRKATVCLYVTPDCYPESKERKGEVVQFPSEIPSNARIYFGDVSEDDQGTLHLGGSRTAGIVGIGNSIEDARQTALSLCKKVKGPIRFRSDIGSIH